MAATENPPLTASREKQDHHVSSARRSTPHLKGGAFNWVLPPSLPPLDTLSVWHAHSGLPCERTGAGELSTGSERDAERKGRGRGEISVCVCVFMNLCARCCIAELQRPEARRAGVFVLETDWLQLESRATEQPTSQWMKLTVSTEQKLWDEQTRRSRCGFYCSCS